MNDDRDRFDLSALDDPAARLRTVNAVTARVDRVLRARRERGPQVWLALARWRVPVLAGATLVAIASLVVIVRVQPVVAARRTDAASAGSASTLAQAAGVPASVANWVETGTPPPAANAFDLSGGR